MVTQRASVVTVDFKLMTPDIVQHAKGIKRDPIAHPRTADGQSLTPKQIRARLRRRSKYGGAPASPEEMEILYNKPIDEWDMEELAYGKPKGKGGKFTGARPKYVSPQLREEAMQRFHEAVKGDMRVASLGAIKTIVSILNDEERDDRGKPIVPASTKLDAAKFLTEHVVGKPTQRVESEMSVKLQGILGSVMVNPAELATGNFMPAHFPGLTMELSSAQKSDDDDDLIPSEG